MQKALIIHEDLSTVQPLNDLPEIRPDVVTPNEI